MKLNAAAATGDQISTSSIHYGGALIVSNLDGVFAPGQSFQLFQAESYAGSFSSVSLPVLGGGLVWSNALATTGTLSVVASVPAIGGMALSGTNLVFTGSGGVAGTTYYVLASTNVALPLAGWRRVLTNFFDGAGGFAVTNAVSGPQQFYVIEVP